MKAKTKNILKGLGVGALACFGMFAMTGCKEKANDMEISNLTAYTIVMEATNKLNTDEILNNLKLTLSLENDDDYQYNYFYKTTSGQFISQMIDMDSLNLIYTTNEGTITYSAHLNSGEIIEESYRKTLSNQPFDVVAQEDFENITMGNLLGQESASHKNIIEAKKLANSSYEISVLGNFMGEPAIATYYIDSNNFLTQLKINFAYEVATFSYEYGTLSDADFAENLAKANSSELK